MAIDPLKLLLLNVIINSNSDTEIIDVLSLVSDNKTRKRSKRSSKSLSNKDKCPCSTLDTASWKPKCSKCKQTWHTACCNLLGIASITELENWECPWCYVPLFRDPSKSSISTSVLDELKTNIQSIDNKCSNFNFPELQNQINDLKNAISSFSSSDSSHVSVNKIHDDVLASIKFELQNIVANQESFRIQEIAELKEKESQSTVTCISSGDTGSRDIFPGKHYVSHQSGFLQQVCKDSLESFISTSNENFVKVGNREVMYFGEFSYKYGNTEHRPSPVPSSIQKLIDEIHDKFPNSTKINSCLVTKYADGSSDCPSHGDDEPFINPKSDIFTFSMGAVRSMKFVNCSDNAANVNDCVSLKDNDLLVFSRASQDFFHHSIVADQNSSQIRYSFTFRSLAPYNINYTTIIGDSNTKDIVFGSDKGKLGLWLPGSRIKASKIKNIPDPFTIGPCRNILLNVGINDVQEDNPKSTECLVDQLDSKIKSIMKVYPKTKVSISLLLPTKISYLNFRVNQLNNGIKRLAANSRNINVIEHSNLVDQFGFLNPVLGRHKRGLPNPDDHVHLGPNGIKRFVLNIKNTILRKKSQPVRGNVGRNQPSPTPPPGPSRAIQHPHPITAAPWANSSIPADGSSHAPALGFPPRPSCPNPSLTYASSVGDHQFGGPRYHSIYPSLTCDGYQQ